MLKLARVQNNWKNYRMYMIIVYDRSFILSLSEISREGIWAIPDGKTWGGEKF